MNTRRISTPTTACIVTLREPRFENAAGAEDPNTITMYMDVKFNGLVGELGYNVSFARNATAAVKNAAVRAAVNEILLGNEGTAALNNANIQIVGLPV